MQYLDENKRFKKGHLIPNKLPIKKKIIKFPIFSRVSECYCFSWHTY